jgi:hypothetical protein
MDTGKHDALVLQGNTPHFGRDFGGKRHLASPLHFSLGK